MHFNVITLFPKMIEDALKYGVVGQAYSSQKITLKTLNPRAFTKDKHHTVDDRPFGGGDGMVMLYEPLKQTIESLGHSAGLRVCLSAHGERWSDSKARVWAQKKSNVTLICGRYGGFDQRFINEFIDAEISIGDYILSGGELAALVIIDSVARMRPEVLGNAESIENESFSADGLLESSLFTRPQFQQMQPLSKDDNASSLLPSVPKVFISGDHKRIQAARRMISLLITAQKRPDLITRAHQLEIKKSQELLKEFSDEELAVCGLKLSFIKDLYESKKY